MATNIEWAEESWNPVTGCTEVGAGCANCYAERWSARIAGCSTVTQRYKDVIGCNGHWNGTVLCHPDVLDKPSRWRKPRRIFVCSMSDLFHPKVPFDFVHRVFGVMAQLPQHQFQVLTKRPEVALKYADCLPWPRNIWLGTSVEDVASLKHRLPYLLKCPAAIRWLSIEPLLEEIDLIRNIVYINEYYCARCEEWSEGGDEDYCPQCEKNYSQPTKDEKCPHCGESDYEAVCSSCEASGEDGGLSSACCWESEIMDCIRRKLQWIVVGGENAPEWASRGVELAWVRNIRDDCQELGIPLFIKQFGTRWARQQDIRGKGRSKGQDMNDWPEDLRVREYPK